MTIGKLRRGKLITLEGPDGAGKSSMIKEIMQELRKNGYDAINTREPGGTPIAEACRNMVKKVLSNFRLPYITVTPVFSVCPVHGYLSGEHEFCPKCDDVLIEKMNLKINSYEDNN